MRSWRFPDRERTRMRCCSWSVSTAGGSPSGPDFVVQEVSIEVFLDGRPTFRGTCSPWDVEDLVVGRLFLEGAIVEMDDVVSIEVDLEGGRVDVLTARVAVGPGTGASSCHLAACRGVLRQACRSRRARCPTCRWRLPR